MAKGWKMTEESKLKISASKTGVKLPPQTEDSNMKRRLSMLGRKLTPEHREKLRLAKLGKKRGPRNPEIVEKIKQANLMRYKVLGRQPKYMSRGYVMVKAENHPKANSRGYIREHRLVIEKHIGRYITGKEEIHHINGDKADNRLENLKLCNDHKEHMQFHVKPPQCT